MRVLRTLLGVLAILLAVPLIGGGAVLWSIGEHQSEGGWFSAPLEEVGTAGYAIVIPDVDDLLRRDASFARGAGTGLRVRADIGGRPAFVGLAPRDAVLRYLNGVPYASVSSVRLALGRLPVTAAQVAGPHRPPTVPAQQPFWVAASVAGTVAFTPGSVRGQRLALVVMRADGRAALRAEIAAAVHPAWLPAATWAGIVVGTLALAAGLALLLWPVRRREIVYVVEPDQVGPLAARLGLRAPTLAALPPAPETTPVAALPAAPMPAPGWLMATGEIVDVSSSDGAADAPITPDFVWPPLAPAGLPAAAVPESREPAAAPAARA